MFELTKNKTKLLKLFYANPGQSYYMHEIGRLLRKKPGVFQRVINKMEREGILTSEYRANARYFRANTRYPIYSELKSILAKADKLGKGKISAAVLLLVFLFAAYSGVWAEEPKEPVPGELSLKQAIASAFKNNKELMIQEQVVEEARAGILYARSAFLPQLNLDASYTHRAAALKSSTVGLKRDYGVFGGYRNDNELGISLEQPIYTGGANLSNLRQAQLSLQVQEETLRAAKLNIEFEAKRLFYGLLLAYESERIAAELVGQAEAHYRHVLDRFQQGASSRFDVLQSKVQVSKLFPQLVKARNSVQLIMAELNKLIGLPVREITHPEGKLSYAPIEVKEDEFLKTAYLHKPEMQLKTLGIDIAKWQIELGKAGFRPQVAAGADYSYRANNTANMFNTRHNDWNIGLTVRVPLFDGFSSKAKVEEAKARYAQADLSKKNLIDQIALDIRQNCLDLQEALAIINSQKDSITEAREALRISEVSYDNGEAINLDILDAQVSLAQIEENLAEGIYDYLMAAASLDRNMGKD